MAKKTGHFVPGKATMPSKVDNIVNTKRDPDRKNDRPGQMAELQTMPTLKTKPTVKY